MFSIPGLDKIKEVTSVLDFNVSAMPFVMPPQVAMGYEIADTLGIKVPKPEDILKMATGEIDNILQGVKGSEIYKQASDIVTKVLSGGIPSDPKELLNSLDWLL
jgi:hypothetical protein